MPAITTAENQIRLVGLCGSLRAVSAHRALLAAAQALFPGSLEVYGDLARLPAFNPDIEGTPGEPDSVPAFRSFLREADAVLIASPEYAHGIPGALKNALDWIVGSGELSGKPVAVLNASVASSHAWAALGEVIRTMDARLIDPASIRIPLPSNRVTAENILADPSLCHLLHTSLSALALSVGDAHP